jgi:hypothetical protein
MYFSISSKVARSMNPDVTFEEVNADIFYNKQENKKKFLFYHIVF